MTRNPRNTGPIRLLSQDHRQPASTSHINSRGASKERDYLGPPKTKPPAAWSSLYEATPGTYQQQTHQRSAANRRPVIQPDARVRSMPSIHQSHSINRLVGRDFYGTFARNFDEDEYVSDRDSVASLFHGEKHSANSPPNTERTAEWVDQLETTKWVGRGTGNTSDKNNIGKQNRARSQYWKKGWHDASDYALGKYDDGTYQKLIKDLENSPKISPADLREYNSGRASAKSLRGY
ncbi:hypothetical protein F4778DRAFT_377685 [Xylariomycetidae sp. FL2044]|nr:hypothetical protein F4778DRAFT_377685 [Xylariomycetidae sp. FL2044]